MFTKKSKKFVAVIVALATIGSCVGTFTYANAATSTVIYGDVNGDGTVDLADAVVLNKYLSGNIDIRNITATDVDANCVIDTIDSKILMYRLVGTIKQKDLPFTGDMT
jgi:hypothetical protein